MPNKQKSDVSDDFGLRSPFPTSPPRNSEKFFLCRKFSTSVRSSRHMRGWDKFTVLTPKPRVVRGGAGCPRNISCIKPRASPLLPPTHPPLPSSARLLQPGSLVLPPPTLFGGPCHAQTLWKLLSSTERTWVGADCHGRYGGLSSRCKMPRRWCSLARDGGYRARVLSSFTMSEEQQRCLSVVASHRDRFSFFLVLRFQSVGRAGVDRPSERASGRVKRAGGGGWVGGCRGHFSFFLCVCVFPRRTVPSVRVGATAVRRFFKFFFCFRCGKIDG